MRGWCRAACPLVGHPKAAPQHGASNSYSAARSLQSRPLGLPTPNGAAPPARFRAAVQLSASRTGRCNFHSGDRTEYDSGDRASPAACHGFREVAKSGAQPEQCSRLSNARASRSLPWARPSSVVLVCRPPCAARRGSLLTTHIYNKALLSRGVSKVTHWG